MLFEKKREEEEEKKRVQGEKENRWEKKITFHLFAHLFFFSNFLL
jgi:hypothetical protein